MDSERNSMVRQIKSKTGSLIWAIVFGLLITHMIMFAAEQHQGKILQIPVPDPNSYGYVQVDELVSVYDGDTFKVNIKSWPDIVGKKLGVRVNGIDTPEIRGTRGKLKLMAYEAREEVRTILGNSDSIFLTNMQRGKYFRVVADVIVDGNDLAQMLMDKGLAKEYHGGTKPVWDINSIR